MLDNEIDDKAHILGHRKRLREKFLKNNAEVFSDQELLEMLLFLSKPRGDVKPLSKRLIKEFGTITKVFHAEPEQLLAVKDVGPSTLYILKLVKGIFTRVLKKEIENKVILQSWSSLMDYLMVTQGHKAIEQFRVLYLNTKNILIADEPEESGTIDQIQVYPREIVKRALFHGASALILVHNHPSGNANPSKLDIEMTKKIVNACATINVQVHDHVIVTKDSFYSFKSNMLI
ncbi:MAG: repair protein RadC [Rickettsiaceae bacterium]|jgi:DNA repair protein RadC|nr:repair protein RadC [Rickettsiaceae bacterium]